MKIEKIQRPENEVQFNEDIIIKGDKPRSNWKDIEIEERDQLEISGNEKEPLQTEYIDELLLEGEIKPENEIQLIDQMEILKQQLK